MTTGSMLHTTERLPPEPIMEHGKIRVLNQNNFVLFMQAVTAKQVNENYEKA